MRTIAEIVTRGKEEMEEEELARELEERRLSLGLDVQGRKNTVCTYFVHVYPRFSIFQSLSPLSFYR